MAVEIATTLSSQDFQVGVTVTVLLNVNFEVLSVHAQNSFGKAGSLARATATRRRHDMSLLEETGGIESITGAIDCQPNVLGRASSQSQLSSSTSPRGD